MQSAALACAILCKLQLSGGHHYATTAKATAVVNGHQRMMTSSSVLKHNHNPDWLDMFRRESNHDDPRHAKANINMGW